MELECGTDVMSYARRFVSRRPGADYNQVGLTPVMIKARLTSGSKYLTVVSSVEGNVFSNNRAISGFFIRAVKSLMTFCAMCERNVVAEHRR